MITFDNHCDGRVIDLIENDLGDALKLLREECQDLLCAQIFLDSFWDHIPKGDDDDS